MKDEEEVDYVKFDIPEQRIEMIDKEIADLKRFQRLQQAFIDDSKYAICDNTLDIERLETVLAEFFEVTLNMEDLSQFHEKLREFIKKLGERE